MADNTTVNAGSGGDTFAADDIGGVKFPRGKIVIGADGTNDGDVSSANPLPVTVSGTITVGSHAVTNAGTFAVQAAQSGTWTVTGAGGTFPVTDSGGSLTVDAPVGTPVFVRLSDGSSAISTLPVSLASVPSHAVTNAGTFAVQVDNTVTVGSHHVTNAGTFAVQAAQSGTWNVTDISGTISLPTGAATAANQSTANTALSAIQTAVQTLDNAISGSEMQVDVVAALPAGTNNIGDVDVLSVPMSIRGPAEPTIDSYTSKSISAAANTADQELVAAPGASKQIWVYGLVGTADTGDGSVSLQDSDNTALSGVMPLLQNGGFAISPSGNFSMPWLKVATNKALEIDTVTCGFKGVLNYAIVSV